MSKVETFDWKYTKSTGTIVDGEAQTHRSIARTNNIYINIIRSKRRVSRRRIKLRRRIETVNNKEGHVLSNGEERNSIESRKKN